MLKNFEMANADDPEEIIWAAQRSIIKAMKEILADAKKETNAPPGLTWEQINYFLDMMMDKKPEIIRQTMEI